MPSAVILAIDGLGAKHLGPYGNTWIETPAFNHLATQSLLVDGLYVPTPNRKETYQKWWQGTGETDLISTLNDNGIHTQLFTDEAELFDYPLSAKFAQQDKIEPPNGVRLADEWDDTHCAKFFAQAIQAIEATPKNSLLWFHSRGLHNPWDAPYAYRKQFVDEDDPDASGSAQVPSLRLDAGYDPDTLHEIQCAFAGQIVLLDRCMGVLLSVIRDLAEQQGMLFILAANAGFPVGEHLVVGGEDPDLLYHETLSVPALLRYPDGQLAMKRRGGVTEITELSDTIVQWLVNRSLKEDFGDRKFSVSRSNGELLLRTPCWHLKFSQLTENRDEDIELSELYLKPDDQNEVNDVSDRCEGVVDAGRNFLRELLRTDVPPEVPEVLLEPLE